MSSGAILPRGAARSTRGPSLCISEARRRGKPAAHGPAMPQPFRSRPAPRDRGLEDPGRAGASAFGRGHQTARPVHEGWKMKAQTIAMGIAGCALRSADTDERVAGRSSGASRIRQPRIMPEPSRSPAGDEDPPGRMHRSLAPQQIPAARIARGPAPAPGRRIGPLPRIFMACRVPFCARGAGAPSRPAAAPVGFPLPMRHHA